MSTVNVLRYSALGLGLFYGFKNDSFLRYTSCKERQDKEFEDKLKLVEEAKKEYARLNRPKKIESPTSATEVNWEDPNLDYASVVLKVVETLKN